MKNKPILIFDFDGTLVDSMPYFAKTTLKLLDDCGVDYPENIVDILTPLGQKGVAKYLLEHFDMGKSEDELIAYRKQTMLQEYTYHIPAKESVKETLLTLKARGYRLNILTASPHNLLDVCAKRLEIFDLFENVWSSEDFGMLKTDAGIYQAVADRLHTTVEQCVFLDDNINALKVGAQAGMVTVGVFDASSADKVEEIKHICNGYVVRLCELLAWLL